MHRPLTIMICLALSSCAGVKPQAEGTGNGGAGGAGAGPATGGKGGAAAQSGSGGSASGGTGTGGVADAGSSPPLSDFPPAPILVPPAPSNAPQLFSTAARTGGAPCIVYPSPGTLMPRNWLRPLFSYNRAADENLYQITLSTKGFAHPLSVYTTDPSYTLDADLWNGLRVSVNDQPITVTIRALTMTGAGTIQTGLYLWNQPASEHNHTPSWDDYQIPPIVID